MESFILAKPMFLTLTIAYFLHECNAQRPTSGGPWGPPQPPEECAGAIPMRLEECAGLSMFKDAVLKHDPSKPDPFREPTLPDCIAPKNFALCTEDMNTTIVHNEPYSNFYVPAFMLTFVQPYCCRCNKDNRMTTKKYENLTDYFLPLKDDYAGRDMIFPVLGSTNTETDEKLYGYYFTPMYPLEGAVFFTIKAASEDMLDALLSGIYGLFPLLLICLLLAFLAGFVGWAMESQGNAEEFRKPFLYGLFDGFWWSFVSMTTVGYGDKAPKSVIGRIFSIFWILSGITICSMFTAALTDAITSASNSKSIEITSGTKVGILKNHLFEASIALQRGALPVYYENLLLLMEEFQKDTSTLSGILMDTYTASFYSGDSDQAKNFNEKDYIWTSSPVSYGILFSKNSDNLFFGKAIRDNSVAMRACLMYAGVSDESTTTVSSGGGESILDHNSALFQPFLYSCLGLIAFIFLFGLIYEKCRIDKTKKIDGNDGESGKEPQSNIQQPKQVKVNQAHNDALSIHGKNNQGLIF